MTAGLLAHGSSLFVRLPRPARAQWLNGRKTLRLQLQGQPRRHTAFPVRPLRAPSADKVHTADESVNSGKVTCQTACKPGSVHLLAQTGRPFLWDAHCWTPRATDPDGGPKTALQTCACRHPYLVLLPVGFAMPLPLPVARCALTAPFHPCRMTEVIRRSALCGTVPGVAPAGRYPAPCFRGARTFLDILRRRGRPAVWHRAQVGPSWAPVKQKRPSKGPVSTPRARC